MRPKNPSILPYAGLHETAGALEKEANLQLHPTPSALVALPQVTLTPKVVCDQFK